MSVATRVHVELNVAIECICRHMASGDRCYDNSAVQCS
jgi:hypothetical protein